MDRIARIDSFRQDNPQFSMIESHDIQRLAARALMSESFDYQTAMTVLVANVREVTDSELIVLPLNVQFLFDTLIDLFLENRLTWHSQQIFLAALQAGFEGE